MSSTRGGRAYNKEAPTVEETTKSRMTEATDLTNILQTLMEERQRREAEFTEERRQRDEEAARRDEEVRERMMLLRDLVEGVRKQGDAAATKAAQDRDVRVSKLSENDDIKAYLLTFERLMEAYKIRPERWAFKLAPNLIGKAQQAYAAMESGAAADYNQLKEAILLRYDVNGETYRQRFRAASVKPSETIRELAVRLDDLATKWTKECDTVAKLRDAMVMEQILNSLPKEVKVWLKERKPTTSHEAAQLADDYLLARKQNLAAEGGEERRGETNPQEWLSVIDARSMATLRRIVVQVSRVRKSSSRQARERSLLTPHSRGRNRSVISRTLRATTARQRGIMQPIAHPRQCSATSARVTTLGKQVPGLSSAW